jgi:hypothetical protein
MRCTGAIATAGCVPGLTVDEPGQIETEHLVRFTVAEADQMFHIE